MGNLLELRDASAGAWLADAAGYDFGHNGLPLLAVLAVIVVAGILLLARR